MSNSNGIISTPIAVSDIKTVLGVTDNGISALCTSSAINKWAKYKPVDYNSTFSNNSGKGSDGKYGLNITTYSSVGTLSSGFLNVLNAGSTTWTYIHPSGGSSSPYRMGDFSGYNHGAVCPIGNIGATTYYLDTNGAMTIMYDLTTTASDNLTLADITINGTALSSYYLGVLLYNTSSGAYVLATSSTTMGSNGYSISLTGMTGKTGTWKCSVFASSVQISVDGSVGSGTFVPVEHSQDTITINAAGTLYGITPIGTWNEAKTAITFSLSLRNDSTAQMTFTNIRVSLIRSTGSVAPAGEVVTTYSSVPNTTVSASSTSTTSEYTMDSLTNNASYNYWLAAYADSVPTIYNEIEETVPA